MLYRWVAEIGIEPSPQLGVKQPTNYTILPLLVKSVVMVMVGSYH